MPVTDLRSALLTRLQASTALAAVVGTRIYPAPRPQSATLPCVEYEVISHQRGHRIGSADGNAMARVQIDCLAESRTDCVSAKQAIEASLDGFGGVVGGVTFVWCSQQDEQDLDERFDDGSDRVLRRISVDYLIKHRVSIPDF